MDKIKFLYRAYRYRYFLDVQEIKFLRRQLNEGEVAVDIGSNKGAYLYWMRQCVGPSGQCFAFEPQLKLFTYLKKMPSLFSWKNVWIEQKGLSSKSGKALLNIPPNKKGHSPGATLNQPEHKHGFEQKEVVISTLDHYFADLHLPPDFIKIDVEGHELDVLKGAKAILKRSKPKLLIECEQRHLQDHLVKDVFDLLEQLGYNGSFFYMNKQLSIKQFVPDRHQKTLDGKPHDKANYVNNFYFV